MTSLEPKKLRQVSSLRSPDILMAIACRADNQHVLVGSSDSHVYEIDLAEEKPQRVVFTGEGHRSYVTGLVAMESQAISGAYDGQLVWWDLEQRSAMRAVAAHDKWIRRVIALPDRPKLVSIADDMRVRVWDAVSGDRIADFSDHAAITPHHFPSMLYAVTASRDGKLLATGDKVGHVAVWSTESWSKLAELEAPMFYTWDPKQRRHSIGGIRSLAFSPDGTRLAIGGVGKIGNIDHLDGKSRLELFDWQAGKRVWELEDEKHKGLIEQIGWIDETDYLLAVGGDHKGFLNVVQAVSGELVHQAPCDGHIHAYAWNPSRSKVLVAAHERLEAWEFGA